MRFAAFQGVIIHWWSRGLRGTTIESLHVSWRAGTMFLGAVTAGRNMGLVGVACIFSTLVALDGPLLQRATSVINVPIENQPVNLNVSLAAEVPAWYTGSWAYIGNGALGPERWAKWSSATFNNTIPAPGGRVRNNVTVASNSPVDAEVSSPWYGDSAMTGFVHGCPKTCKAKLRAPALAISSCRNRIVEVDYKRRLRTSSSDGPYPLDVTEFLITLNLLTDQQHERIDLLTGFCQLDSNCDGVFNFSTCTLVSAVGEYDVTITDNTVTLDPLKHPTIVALANNTHVDHGTPNGTLWHPSTLAGIVYTGYQKWRTHAEQWIREDGAYTTEEYGAAVLAQYVNPDPKTCYSYSDPKDDVIRSLNKLMFYTGIAAAAHPPYNMDKRMDPALPTDTTVTGWLQGEQTVYHTDFSWFLAAAIVEGICIALILPTYWGWWRFGRPVSLSPIEIAKAFEAPILSTCNSNASGRDISKCFAGASVQYGVTRAGVEASSMKLAFGDPAVTNPPWKGARFAL